MRRFIAVLPTFVRLMRLSWNLLGDPRVPLHIKAIPAVALAYILSPVDLVPDFLPLLGQLDDVLVAWALLALFVRFGYAAITDRQADSSIVEGRFQVIDDD